MPDTLDLACCPMCGALPIDQAEALRESDSPPPHWTAGDGYERHPQTAEEWDWRADSPNGPERSLKRLNFAADLADPHAPDQMALVLRIDIMRLEGGYIHQRARADSLKARLDASLSRISELESALRRIKDGDIPRPIGKAWRADGKPSALDRCVHDNGMREDCGQCVDAFARNVLGEKA